VHAWFAYHLILSASGCKGQGAGRPGTVQQARNNLGTNTALCGALSGAEPAMEHSFPDVHCKVSYAVSLHTAPPSQIHCPQFFDYKFCASWRLHMLALVSAARMCMPIKDWCTPGSVTVRPPGSPYALLSVPTGASGSVQHATSAVRWCPGDQHLSQDASSTCMIGDMQLQRGLLTCR
jgi:hypothetical protein